VRLRFKRVPEEQHEIDLAIADLGTQLLVATERTALEQFNFYAEFARDHRPSRTCAEQGVLHKDCPVEDSPIEKIDLLVVVGDERDASTFLKSRTDDGYRS